MALKYRLQGLLNAKLNLSALTSVACPFAGIANLYASSTVGFALSGVNYWKIQGIRQSFAEQSNYKSNQADAITAYEEFFLGSFTVGQGDVLSIVLTQTGAPAALTVANITVRCELTPKDLGNA